MTVNIFIREVVTFFLGISSQVICLICNRRLIVVFFKLLPFFILGDKLFRLTTTVNIFLDVLIMGSKLLKSSGDLGNVSKVSLSDISLLTTLEFNKV